MYYYTLFIGAKVTRFRLEDKASTVISTSDVSHLRVCAALAVLGAK